VIWSAAACCRFFILGVYLADSSPLVAIVLGGTGTKLSQLSLEHDAAGNWVIKGCSKAKPDPLESITYEMPFA
jgi:hypothetical protein